MATTKKKKTFTKQSHKNNVELSKEYWKVKQQNRISGIME